MDLQRIKMTLPDIAQELEKTNPDAAKFLTEVNENFQSTLGRVQTLEKDIKSAAEKRDSLKTIIRNATGLEEINEEALSEYLTSKGDGQAEILKKELQELQGRLSESANAVDEVSSQYEKQIFDLKLDRAVNMLGVQDEVHSPHAYHVILEELSQGAQFDGDEIVYKNPDGTTIFTADGKPAGLKARYEEMKADEKFSYLFKDQFKSGGGKSPAPKGPTVGENGVTLKRSQMSDTEKVKYISKNGMAAYKLLPM